MTVKELLTAVKALTEEYDYFNGDVFVSAAQTALGTLFSEMNTVGSASIYLSCPRILRHVPKIRHVPGNTESVRLFGAAYSFKVFGTASIRIFDGRSTISDTYSGNGVILSGFIHGEGTADFFGDLAYTVGNFTLFSEYESPDKDDIPIIGENRAVNIASLVNDFSRAISFPTDGSGAPLANVRIENGNLICPKDFSGEVRFKYKKRAPSISLDVPNFEIPVLAEAESALVLLTAAYMLGESESDAADFFLKEYKRNVSRISREGFPSEGGNYYDTTGWA